MLSNVKTSFYRINNISKEKEKRNSVSHKSRKIHPCLLIIQTCIINSETALYTEVIKSMYYTL